MLGWCCDAGRRDDRKQARLKYLVSDWGMPKFRSVVEQYLGKKFESFRWAHTEDRSLPCWQSPWQHRTPCNALLSCVQACMPSCQQYGKVPQERHSMLLLPQAAAQVGVPGLPGVGGAGRRQVGVRGFRAERPSQGRDEEGVAAGVCLAPVVTTAAGVHMSSAAADIAVRLELHMEALLTCCAGHRAV